MKKFVNKISFIIATKDRPTELLRLLESLQGQTYHPDTIIIVDASNKTSESLITRDSDLNIHYVKSSISSAAKQRNTGIGMVAAETTLVGFLDDDVVLEPVALEIMMEFWEYADKRVAGAAFNMANPPAMYFSSLKFMPLTKRLGLYSDGKGKVLPNGFHTMIGHVFRDTQVQWLFSGATVWRCNIFNEFQFDEWFSGYSYLEDLDFSYRVAKRYILAVVADAKCYHHLVPGGRGNNYEFGKKEAVNRIYFVMKNPELSLFKCYLALFIRMLISLSLGICKLKITFLQRSGGNLVGLWEGIFHKKELSL